MISLSLNLVKMVYGGMKNRVWITSFSMFVICVSLPAQSLIINHNDISAFDSIPGEYKTAAANLRMLFMDRSVGGNIDSYLDCLSGSFDEAPNYCKRTEHQDTVYNVDPGEVYWEDTWDRTNWHYAFWPNGCSEDVNCFIDYTSTRLDSFDVIGCQFSYLAVLPGSAIADPSTGFFGMQGNDNKATVYAAFGDAHPDKKLVWWTTSLARGIGTIESETFNAQMRDYAVDHEIILFDVADILSHDPNGQPCFDNRDGIAYKDENHPDDGLSLAAICPQYTTETEGGHLGSVSAGGIRVAKAFWVLMARIAGWDGLMTTTDNISFSTPRIYPNPASHIINVADADEWISNGADFIIRDFQGRHVLNGKLSNIIQLPIHFPPGLYTFHSFHGHHSFIAKILVF